MLPTPCIVHFAVNNFVSLASSAAGVPSSSTTALHQQRVHINTTASATTANRGNRATKIVEFQFISAFAKRMMALP